MTTSQTIHDNLLALSQKGKKKKQETKAKFQGRSAATRRIVELAKVVFVAPRGGHRIAAVEFPNPLTKSSKAIAQDPVSTVDRSKDSSATTAPSAQNDDDVSKPDPAASSAIADDQNGKKQQLPFQHYRNLQQQLAQELQQLEERRRLLLQKQAGLWDVYKFGLEKISNLSDLRDAPDAILPGNFPLGEGKQEPMQQEPENNVGGTMEEFSTRI